MIRKKDKKHDYELEYFKNNISVTKPKPQPKPKIAPKPKPKQVAKAKSQSKEQPKPKDITIPEQTAKPIDEPKTKTFDTVTAFNNSTKSLNTTNTTIASFQPTESEKTDKPKPIDIKAQGRVWSGMTDKEGIDRAYKAKDGVYIHGNRMYISGTRNMQDVWDDVTKVSMYDKLIHSERYQQAKQALDENPQVKHLSGHSLGGVSRCNCRNVIQIKLNQLEHTVRLFSIHLGLINIYHLEIMRIHSEN